MKNFEAGLKKIWGDRRKIVLLEKRISGNKKFGDTVLLFICQTRYRPNLSAMEQIPSDLWLPKGAQKMIRTLTFKIRRSILFNNSWYL